MAAIADKHPHLVQQRGNLEQQLKTFVETMFGLQFAEQADAQFRNLFGMFFIEGVFLAEGQRGLDGLLGEPSVHVPPAAISFSSPSRKLVLGTRICFTWNISARCKYARSAGPTVSAS